jgi:transcriptional regulator with XRE-family HTH domain
MNLTQMHDRLRLELLRRIQRGTLSVSLLARQTGFGQSHLSNYLHGRRQLSLDAIDRILAAQHLTAVDLLPSAQGRSEEEYGDAVPVVTQAAALFEPLIRASSVQLMLQLPASFLQSAQARAVGARRGWQRFVAVRLSAADALPMEPLLLPEAIVLIDRHYNSLLAYRPNRPNLYAVREGAHLLVRYVEYASSRLVLRPINPVSPIELIEVDSEATPNELVIGRVVLVLNEL